MVGERQAGDGDGRHAGAQVDAVEDDVVEPGALVAQHVADGVGKLFEHGGSCVDGADGLSVPTKRRRGNVRRRVRPDGGRPAARRPACTEPRALHFIVLFAALAMPLTGWLSSRGAFGPDNATLAARYPNLLAAAGYAFAIWGLIYLLDLAWAVWQASAARRYDRALQPVRPWVVIGFLLTAAWPVAFGQQVFWLALAIIWAISPACSMRRCCCAPRPAAASPGCRPRRWRCTPAGSAWRPSSTPRR